MSAPRTAAAARGAHALAAIAPLFSRKAGALHAEGVPLERLAARYGTPLYVYSATSIENAFRRLDAAFAGVPHTLCYSVKSNGNLEILRRLARLGSGFDIVSGGELYRVRRAGAPASRVVFSGVGKTREEIREALRERILLFNAESAGEVEILAEEAARLGRTAPVGLRVNLDVAAGGHPYISTGRRAHKFGIVAGEALRLIREHRRNRALAVQGISTHIGSQILNLAPIRRAVRELAALARRAMAEGIGLRYFDVGGGLGIRYSRELPVSLRAYSRAVLGELRPLGLHLLLEPGRWISGPAGMLVTRVLYRKTGGGRRFVVVDAGMNDFLRPALYGAFHPVIAVRRAGGRTEIVDVVGPVCETADCFAQGVRLDPVAPGDLLAILGAGAYGAVAASNYNARPRPAEVLVRGSRATLVRRRESREDLLRGE
jgi:diaminopimelate decarboxylase